jgi:predicted RNA-binding Zn-ribbon protein involved in translation (DUF1610 family)
MMECPQCGEAEHLRGDRHSDAIHLTCESCGASWRREVGRRCANCGSDNLRYTPRPLWEKGRGDQRTPAGRIDVYFCINCGDRDAVPPLGGRR